MDLARVCGGKYLGGVNVEVIRLGESNSDCREESDNNNKLGMHSVRGFG